MTEKHIILSQIVPHIRFAHYTEWDKEHFCPPSISYDCRLLYVVDGEGVINISSASLQVACGHLIIFRYGTQYSITTFAQLKILMMNFDFTQDGCDIPPFVPVAPDMFIGDSVCSPIVFNDTDIFDSHIYLKNAANFYPVLLNIYEELSSRRIHSTHIADLKFGALLCDIARSTQLTDAPLKVGADIIAKYILENFYQNITDAFLSEMFHYHPNHIRKLIFDYTGMTTHSYILECRLGKAMELVIETELPLQTISKKIGFSDFSVFSKAFKRKYGRSPSEYRKY